MKAFDAWLIDWMDGRYYATRHQTIADFWGRRIMAACARFRRKYGEDPSVSNG